MRPPNNLSASEYLLHLSSRYAQHVEKFSGEFREVRECKEQIKQLERGKRQLELYLKNADERVVIEQSIALRHTEQSSALEFENRRLHAELTLAQKMLADREAIEVNISMILTHLFRSIVTHPLHGGFQS